jgi:hypothetical protein
MSSTSLNPFFESGIKAIRMNFSFCCAPARIGLRQLGIMFKKALNLTVNVLLNTRKGTLLTKQVNLSNKSNSLNVGTVFQTAILVEDK